MNPPSSIPPASGPVRSVATIALALCRCDHPEPCRVSANAIVTAKPVRITWCAQCGAISDDDTTGSWQASALVCLLSPRRFHELARILDVLGRFHVALERPDTAAHASLEPGLFDALASTTRTDLYADREPLDGAVALMAQHAPGP